METTQQTGLVLSNAVRAAHVGSFAWEVDEDVVLWSEELYRIHGMPPSQFAGTFGAFLELVHPVDVPVVQHVVVEALRRPGPFRFDHRIVRPDGEIRTIHTQGDIEKDAQGRPLRLLGSCWDVTEPASAWQELERSLSLVRATLDATEDGILVVDRDGRVVACNDRFLRLWRIPHEMAERRDDRELLCFVGDQLVDPDGFLSRVQELYASPEAVSRDVLRFQDGRTFERCSRPQRLGDEIVGRVWSFHDVTEREQALAAREQFLAIAAHEIRGPLMSIQIAVQSMQEEALPPEVVPRLLDVAGRETRRLARFVNQLLDVGRLRAGKLELQLEDVGLLDVVCEVVAQMQGEADRSGSVISVRAEGRPVGRWDPLRLGQIVTNLLSNAIKFGEGRPVEVRIAEHEGQAVVSVQDHGIGISKDALECIFEPFERRVSTRHYGGLGLGLHIVQSLVRAMGGRVTVSSEPGLGSTFAVELPVGGP